MNMKLQGATFSQKSNWMTQTNSEITQIRRSWSLHNSAEQIHPSSRDKTTTFTLLCAVIVTRGMQS